MAGILNLVYSVIVLLVASVGVVFVLWTTGPDETDATLGWQNAVVMALVVAFLLAMIAGINVS